MQELVSPIIGILLVLLAVFIPTILISGITGQLYKQFAITISAATAISAFNSLTLTPTLCALFLKYDKPSNFFLYKYFNAGYAKVQGWYDWTTEWLLKHRVASVGSFLLLSAITALLFVKLPSSFIPTEDEGYFLISTQLPPASSLYRTEAVNQKIDKILATYPEIKTYTTISGFSIMGGGQVSNGATYFVILKNWKERKGKQHTAMSIVNRFNKDAYGIQEASVFAMVPPAIPGLGATGGLQLELEDRMNLGSAEMQNAINALMENYKNYPELLSLQSMYQANVPKYLIKIDRDKVDMLGLNISDVFSTLSFYMGGAYVNDYIEFGRIYQVNLAASEKAQRMVNDINHLSVSNSKGEMVPFTSFSEFVEQVGLNQVDRYNMYSAASITCNENPKYSSGQAIAAMESLVKSQLGKNFGYEWTSVAYQETQSGSSTVVIFLMAIIVAYMVLAAQYESWTSPIAAMVGIPLALLGAMLGCLLMGQSISVYTQIGIILLIALAAKNAILIVEFSMDSRKAGQSIRDAAIAGGKVRLRPIMMTSFAFILGVMPMLFATGAGANSRIALGTAVVFGMLANTLIATLYVPSAYEWFETFDEKYLSKLNPARNQDKKPTDAIADADTDK
jgi:hydrophobe/amphiphile efflux-1 (HAE1) family protein